MLGTHSDRSDSIPGSTVPIGLTAWLDGPVRSDGSGYGPEMDTTEFECCLGDQNSIVATLNVRNCWLSGLALKRAMGTIHAPKTPAHIGGWPSFITWPFQLARMCFYASWVVNEHIRPTYTSSTAGRAAWHSIGQRAQFMHPKHRPTLVGGPASLPAHCSWPKYVLMHHGQPAMIPGPSKCCQLVAGWPGIESGTGRNVGAQNTCPHSVGGVASLPGPSTLWLSDQAARIFSVAVPIKPPA